MNNSAMTCCTLATIDPSWASYRQPIPTRSPSDFIAGLVPFLLFIFATIALISRYMRPRY